MGNRIIIRLLRSGKLRSAMYGKRTVGGGGGAYAIVVVWEKC